MARPRRNDEEHPHQDRYGSRSENERHLIPDSIHAARSERSKDDRSLFPCGPIYSNFGRRGSDVRKFVLDTNCFIAASKSDEDAASLETFVQTAAPGLYQSTMLDLERLQGGDVFIQV